MWKLVDENGRRINHGDYVRTLSGRLMVLRDWTPPPVSYLRARVVLHDEFGEIHEHQCGTIGARCVKIERR